MAWLNYHHLLYFWTVARTGGIAPASKELFLSQATVSAQLKLLEESLGVPLLQRQGRKLVLTEMGQLVFRYADDIFRLGRELQLAVEGRAPGRRLRLTVGVAEVIPKLVAERLLRPALAAFPDLVLECREGSVEQLVGQLALHELDVVLSDIPASAELHVRAFSHTLGETALAFFGAPRFRGLKKGFPKSLDGAPFLFPSGASVVRRYLDAWFEVHEVRPVIAGEFDDSALLKAFGRQGTGVFVAPAAIAAEVSRQYEVEELERAEDLRERFYAISVERKLKHPAVVAVVEAARRQLFA